MAEETTAAVAPVQTEADDAGSEQETGTVLTNSETGAVDATAEESTDSGDAEGGEGSEESGQATPPDTYADFAMPEGVEVDSALLEQALPLFKELGLTQEQAQTLVDFQAGQVQAGSEKAADDFNQMMTQWQTDARNDSEFGGDKFEENTAIARAAVDKFGTPALKELLVNHGVGNHPEMIRFMLNVGKLTLEDVPGSLGGSPVMQGADAATVLYPAG